jgi:hypothetical protein
MNWERRCYIVIADSVSGMPPLLHGVRPTQWEAFRALEQTLSALPGKLTQNLRVVPAHLVFNDTTAEDEDSAKETDT